MWDILDEAARELPDKTAIVHRERRITYREYLQEVDLLARGLLALGLEPGERVGLLMPTVPEHAFAFNAVIKAGGEAVLLNSRLQAQELEYLLNDCRPALLMMSPEFRDTDFAAILHRPIAEKPFIRSVVMLGDCDRFPHLTWDGLREKGREIDFSDLARRMESLDPERTVTIIYTSGTTGVPKGAMISERNIRSNLDAWWQRLEVDENDVVGVFFPLFHAAGAIGGVVGCATLKATMVLDDFSPAEVLRYIQEEGITVLGGVAAMVAILKATPGFADHDLSSLRFLFMGAGPCPAEVLKDVRELMGADTVVGYGLTEATMGNVTTTLLDDSEEHKLHTIGLPLPGVEVRVVDENYVEVPRGEIGEIAIRGDTVFKGYLNMPEYTAEVLDDEGWLYTGDLAFMDDAGYLHMAGRMKEMYIRGGENVYPSEVEEVITRHPQVMLAAVIGIPHPVYGEVGRAYVMSPGGGVTPEEIKEWVAGHLADYKVPEEVIIRDMLPLTPVGKVLKKALEGEMEQERE
jgi:acyl-CoA synthetase (AMP-forming)/AMP-acid ligase II